MCAPSSCWGSGAANNPGDLDDANASVHPENSEVNGDGRDNDQDGLVDETEFLYSTTGYNNSATGFDLHARLNASSLINDGTLYAKVTWWGSTTARRSPPPASSRSPTRPGFATLRHPPHGPRRGRRRAGVRGDGAVLHAALAGRVAGRLRVPRGRRARTPTTR